MKKAFFLLTIIFITSFVQHITAQNKSKRFYKTKLLETELENIKLHDSLQIVVPELEYYKSFYTNDFQELQIENTMLRDSLQLVVSELEHYKLDPTKLCANIDKLYKDENINALDSIRQILIKFHPECDELKKAESMYSQIVIKQQKEKQIEEEKAKRMSAVSKLKKEYDDVSNITWFYNPYFNHGNGSNRMSLYIGKKGSNVWLRLKMSFGGSSWIFFDNAYLSYDGNTREIYFNEYRDKESDNYGGYVWEWIDVPVNGELLLFLKKFANGKSLKMRLSGKYTTTRELSEDEIMGIKDVLLAYDVLRMGE